MAIFNFTYNGIDVEVNTTEYTIKYIELGFSSIRTWYCDMFTPVMSDKVIVVTPRTNLIDGVTGKAQGAIENRKIRSFKDPDFTFFYSLTNQSLSFGEITTRAMINNQLESMSDVFGEPFHCFSASNNWEYFVPIEASVSSVLTTEEFDIDENPIPKEYDVTATVVTIGTWEYQLTTSDDTLITDWSSVNSFTGIASGEYKLSVRSESSTDIGVRVFTIILS